MASHLPLRILLTFRGIDRKFATIIAARDNSFYIHPYRPSGQPWRIPRAAPPSTGVPSGTGIDFENYIEPPLQLNKLSIHPSGFMHVADGGGTRYRSGVKGTPFDEMVFPQQVCLVVPCYPEELPVYSSERGHTARVPLHSNIGPFYLSVAVIEAAQPPATPRAANLVFEDLRFGLSLTTHLVIDVATGGSPGWPPFPFLVLAAA